MRIARRVAVAFGALVEGALIVWLFSGFLPAGFGAALIAVLIGGAIYSDIRRREEDDLR